MANQLFIPILNPLQFYWTDRPFPVGKNFYLLGEDWFTKQTPNWYQNVNYLQKWQQTDTINLQVKANFDPITWRIINCQGRTVKTGDFVRAYPQITGQPFSWYETPIQLADVDEGEYYVVITAGIEGSQMSWISEPLDISLIHEDTSLFGYKCDKNNLDIAFDTGIEFYFRCEGSIFEYDPGTNSKVYEDQVLNMVQLSATPYDQFKMKIGGSWGVPNWVAKKLNTIFCCDTVLVEGMQFVKADGAKLERNSAERYPMSGWTMDIRPALNRFSDFADSSFNDKVTIVYNVDARVFGTMNDLPENNTIQIIDTNG